MGVGGDGVFQVVGALAADALPQGVVQFVLGGGPLDGEGFPRVNLQGVLEGGDGPFQVVGAVAANAV